MGQFRDVSIKNVIEELNDSFFLPDWICLKKLDD